MKRYKNVAYQIEWIYTVDYPGRPVPLVVLSDGQPGYAINQWIYWLLQEGISPSLLEQHIRAVMHLYEFHYRLYRGQNLIHQQAESLIADFLDAKRRGSELMGWNANNNRQTLMRYLSSINLFDKWQSTFRGGPRMNPCEQRFMSDWERYRDFQQRTKWDPMFHLFPSRAHMKTVHEHKVRIEHQRFRVGKKDIPKSFPIERFVDLVEHTPNPRDQMLWLLMGGGSLRASETLHLYYQDVLGVDRMGATRIRLDDPDTGEITWEKDGKLKTGSRTEYLAECYANEQFKFTVPGLYHLSPRTQGKRGADHAGFKGMTFATDGENKVTPDGRIIHWHELFWSDYRFGIRFQRAYEVYINEHFLGKAHDWPHHPYLFITLEKSRYGLPLTLSGIRRAWKRALTRIGLADSGLGYHSLRHMYGSYCASILKLPLETTRILMHHASITSTEVYYHLHSADVRSAIIRAVVENADVTFMDYLIMPGAPCLQMPGSWNE